MAVTFAASPLFALDLPTKVVNGKQVYYYVTTDETLYALSHRLGISNAEIIKYNPWAADGIKPGRTLYFPAEAFASKFDDADDTTEYIVKSGDTLLGIAKRFHTTDKAIIDLNPGAELGIKVGQRLILPANNESGKKTDAKEAPDANVKDTTKSEQAIPELPQPEKRLTPVQVPTQVLTTIPAVTPVSTDNPLHVAICLPFMINEETLSRQATYATDFYRGFLLGIDSLRAQYGNPEIHISAIDSGDPSQAFAALERQEPGLRNADIIIAPEAANRLADLARYAEVHSKYVLNNFLARDTTYLNNAAVIQGNIAANDMYKRIFEYFVSHLDGATPIFLCNENGAKDKQAFVDELSTYMLNNGVSYKTLTFSGSMTSSAFADYLPVDSANYVFIPMSGSLSEFHKFATALANYKQQVAAAETPGRVSLFAYPEYTRFSSDALDKLKAIGTTFYSRFYNDSDSPSTDAIKASFADRYGSDLPDGVPNQALYGFDVSRWLLAIAAQGAVNPQTITETVIENAAQTPYRFVPVEGGGFVNDAVYIVELSDTAPVKTTIL